jgi:hypothetical protein
MTELRVRPLAALPDVRPGDDLAALLAAAGADALAGGDVLVVAHKVVSKAEGAIVALDDVQPGGRARELARQLAKDARHVQVVLDQSAAVLRAERGVLVCRTHHGFVCANAGVDASNAAPGTVVCLPRDPDASARGLRAALPGPPGGRHHRLLRPRLAPRAGRRGDRRRRAWRRSRTGAGAPTRAGASCARPGSPSPTRPPRPPTSSAPRTPAAPPSRCPGSSATSRPRTGRAPRRSCAPSSEDLFT